MENMDPETGDYVRPAQGAAQPVAAEPEVIIQPRQLPRPEKEKKQKKVSTFEANWEVFEKLFCSPQTPDLLQVFRVDPGRGPTMKTTKM